MNSSSTGNCSWETSRVSFHVLLELLRLCKPIVFQSRKKKNSETGRDFLGEKKKGKFLFRSRVSRMLMLRWAWVRTTKGPFPAAFLHCHRGAAHRHFFVTDEQEMVKRKASSRPSPYHQIHGSQKSWCHVKQSVTPIFDKSSSDRRLTSQTTQ